VHGGSIKSVGSAVGEGSIAISLIHKVLQDRLAIPKEYVFLNFNIVAGIEESLQKQSEEQIQQFKTSFVSIGTFLTIPRSFIGISLYNSALN
jgi:hypothetical protein